MKTSYLIVTAFVLSLIACAGEQEARIEWSPPPADTSVEPFSVIDHKPPSIPEWVSRYEAGGVQAIEAMSAYQNKYVFVSINRGTNTKALELWLSGFSVLQDFPRLVSARVQARFSNAASSYPDGEYGNYFEASVKATTDAVYQGAVREDDFWVLKRYFLGENWDVYEFLILLSIDKTTLGNQINTLLNTIPFDSLSKEQIDAVNQLRASFYEDF
ncbi:MAG: hypothetical protein LBD79_07880 [Treponema sp.]|jgi:hypothetical protein|nr:hypothetical protein [Treponema sp.]